MNSVGKVVVGRWTERYWSNLRDGDGTSTWKPRAEGSRQIGDRRPKSRPATCYSGGREGRAKVRGRCARQLRAIKCKVGKVASRWTGISDGATIFSWRRRSAKGYKTDNLTTIIIIFFFPARKYSDVPWNFQREVMYVKKNMSSFI